jgi:uncharacterized membrane protein YfcA
VFGGIALLVALHMAFGRESWRIAEAPPAGPLRLAIAVAVGFVSVMMGLGGGTVGVPTLTLLGVRCAARSAPPPGSAPRSRARCDRARARGIGVPGRPPGCVGYLNLLGFALIVPTTWLAAPLRRALRARGLAGRCAAGFALFLLIVGAAHAARCALRQVCSAAPDPEPA